MFNKNIISFFKKKIEYTLNCKVYRFCNENLNEIEYFFGNRNLKYVKVESISYQNVHLLLNKNGIVNFVLNVCPELSTSFYERGEKEEYSSNNVWIDCLCEGNINDGLRFIKIIDIGFHNDIKVIGRRLGTNLIPQIKKEEFVSLAEDFLKQFNPNCLDSSEAVNLEEIISKLGYNIIYRRFPSSEKPILGRTYFERSKDLFIHDDGTEFEEILPSNTIVVDSNANIKLSEYSIRSTLAHELAHIVLHRNIHKLISFFGDGVNKTDAYNAMEKQANILASYFLLPPKAFTYSAKKQLEFLKESCVENRLVYELLINDLSKMYKVTKQIVKRTLFGIGFTQVVGAFEYIDGNQLRSYHFSLDNFSKLETYSLSTSDFEFNLKTDSKLRGLCEDGVLCFVENHLVINNRRYIYIKNGAPFLTNYALNHIDECSYKFKLIRKNEILEEDNDFSFSSPNRIVSNDFHVSPNCQQTDGYLKSFLLTAEELGNKKRDISNILKSESFGVGLKKLMDYLEVDPKGLAIDSDLDETTISRYINNKKSEFNKKTIIAMAIGLHLEPELSKMFLGFAGFTLTDRKEDDQYNWALTYCYKYNVKKVNELLAEQGYEPLTRTKI